MGQKLLLAVGGLLVVAAIAIGVIGAGSGGFTTGAFQLGPVGGSGTVQHGMMGGYGPGGMIGSRYGSSNAPGAATISIDLAQQAVEQYVARYGGSNLELDELIEFQDNFYAIVKEKSTGIGAFEVLIDRSTATVTPEPGPNMMWNTKYGAMGGGMMGFLRPSGTLSVSADSAAQIAQAWLDSNLARAKVETPDTFYGYYTVHFTQSGKVAGMLSVNGYSGQVWFHTWHGSFIQEKQVGA